MVKLRLKRVGSKNNPSYRIVAAEVTAPRDGRYIEQIGTYNPMTDPPTVRFDEERAAHWLKVGAHPTDTVARLLRNAEIAGAPKRVDNPVAAVAKGA